MVDDVDLDDGSDAFPDEFEPIPDAQVRAAERQDRADWEDERRRIPPEWRGHTWEQRTAEGVIQSRFPPATVGIPSVDFEPFRDFQNHHIETMAREHPEYRCDRCQQLLPEPTFRAGGRTCPVCLGTTPRARRSRQ